MHRWDFGRYSWKDSFKKHENCWQNRLQWQFRAYSSWKLSKINRSKKISIFNINSDEFSENFHCNNFFIFCATAMTFFYKRILQNNIYRRSCSRFRKNSNEWPTCVFLNATIIIIVFLKLTNKQSANWKKLRQAITSRGLPNSTFPFLRHDLFKCIQNIDQNQ